MKFIKKHKLMLAFLIIFVIIIGLALYGINKLIFPDSNIDLYGNRLDGIEEVVIADEKIDDIKTLVTNTNKVNTITYHLSGRIINFIIDVKPTVDLVGAKTLADTILGQFVDEEKSFYDIQIFITSSEDEASELYPIIGYKHKTSLSFVWTNNG